MSTIRSPIIEPPDEPLPPQRPLERHAHLETDAFCEGCGYNLHGQAVHRDERLGLMVCRCPECARFHAAGNRTAATSLWMSRLAAYLLFLWVLTVLSAIFFSAIGFGAIQMLHVDAFTYMRLVAPDGREVAYEQINGTGPFVQVYAGTTQPASRVNLRNIRTFRPPSTPGMYERAWWLRLILLMFAASLGVACGVLLVVFLWHWRKPNYLWMLFIPFISAGFLISTIWFDQMYDAIRTWSIQRILFWAFVEAGFMGLGIMIGRPIARMLLRMFVPPKPRQHLAFLWKVDGKTPPPASHPSIG